MPGRMFLTTPAAQVAQALGTSVFPSDEPARRNISPGEEILVFDGNALTHMRWGLIPVGRVNARGRPVMETIINARSETVFDKSAFDGVSRAVVPADGWYEWTGKTRRKQAWSIRAQSGDLLFFAAITDVWEAPGGLKVTQVATESCESSADVSDIPNRMGVLLKAPDVPVWLAGGDAPRALTVPYPDGSLMVSKADDVDWSAP